MFRYLLCILFLSGVVYAEDIEWSEAKQYKKSEGRGLYYDTLSRNPDAFKWYDNKATTAHEINHGIQSEIRNNFVKKYGKVVNAFHVGNGKVAIMPEPKIRKNWIRGFIPESLRGARYQLYIEEQLAWDDRPLYVFDEWACYVLDCKVNLEEIVNNPPKNRSNAFDACTEFSVYAIALAMAVDKYDKNYIKNNPQFKNFIKWHLKESIETYNKGMEYKAFQWDMKYYDKLKTSRAAEPLRAFVRDKLGMMEDEWLK